MSNTLKISPAAQVLFFVSGAWLILSGISEMATTSQGNKYGSWFEETSLIALNRRGQGSLKLGLGIGLLGVGSLPVSNSSKSNDANLKNTQPEVEAVSGDNERNEIYNAAVKAYIRDGGKKSCSFSNSEIYKKKVVLRDSNWVEIKVMNLYDGQWIKP